MPCPRCGAAVTGDFKFCPTCAYRLRTEEPPADAPRSRRDRWMAVGATLLLGLLLVGILVLGLRLFSDPVPNGPVTNGEVRGVLTVRGHLLRLFVNVPPGVAAWWPDPLRPGEKELPVYVPYWSRVMKYEVTRGMYAEFVADCRDNPEKVPPFLRQLWREDEAYVDRWWALFSLHLERAGAEYAERPAAFRAPLPDVYRNLLSVPPSWVSMTAFEDFRWELPEGTHNLPVTEVSWYDAIAFAQWAKRELGLQDTELRLPLEMEWHLAGNGGDPGRSYPWGGQAFVYASNNLNWWGGVQSKAQLHRVDFTYADADGQTRDGIWAMSGNAREWAHNQTLVRIEDRYQVEVAPGLEGERWEAPTLGGSYAEGIRDCTIDPRSVRYKVKIGRWPEVGFRLWMHGDPMGR